jgi:hypothetical protein
MNTYSPKLVIPLALDRDDWKSPEEIAVFKFAKNLVLETPLVMLIM